METKHRVIKLMDLPPRPEKPIKIYPGDGEITDGSSYILYHHVDGMYSYCTTEKEEIIHLGVMTPLEEYKDGYQIVDERDASAD